MIDESVLCPVTLTGLGSVELERRIEEALGMALRFGQIDGAHHKTWVIDQVVRALVGEKYEEWVEWACTDNDGNTDAYEWDEGIAP